MPIQTTHPPVISATEASKILGVNRSTVHRWVSEGRLRSISIGNSIVLWEDEVNGLAESRRQAIFAELVGRSIPRARGVEVSVVPTADKQTYRITLKSASGKEVSGDCVFDQDPIELLGAANRRR